VVVASRTAACCLVLSMLSAGVLGGSRALSEEAASSSAGAGHPGGPPPGASTAPTPSGGKATGEPPSKAQPAKEKPLPPQRTERKGPSGKQSGKESSGKDIDVRLPAYPDRKTGPVRSHIPVIISPNPLPGSRPPGPIGLPNLPGVLPPPAATRASPMPHPGSANAAGDAAKNAFGAVTHQGRPLGTPRTIGAAANHGIINGTGMSPRAAGPATVGGPAKNLAIINGTTIRPKR
jgi:hypothetical protein